MGSGGPAFKGGRGAPPAGLGGRAFSFAWGSRAAVPGGSALLEGAAGPRGGRKVRFGMSGKARTPGGLELCATIYTISTRWR